jgi:hypothetical protein
MTSKWQKATYNSDSAKPQPLQETRNQMNLGYCPVARTDGTIFAKQVIRTYVIPCLRNILHIALDDGVFRRPIMVKIRAIIS